MLARQEREAIFSLEEEGALGGSPGAASNSWSPGENKGTATTAKDRFTNLSSQALAWHHGEKSGEGYHLRKKRSCHNNPMSVENMQGEDAGCLAQGTP